MPVYLIITFVGILMNPFHELRPAALLAAVGFMALWWPIVATLEGLASVRLRSESVSSRSAEAAREALTSIGSPAALLTLVGLGTLALLWGPVHDIVPAAFITAFFLVNSALLGGGLLVTEIVRHVRAARRRRRIDTLLTASR